MAGLSPAPTAVLSVKCVIFGSVGLQTARFDLSRRPLQEAPFFCLQDPGRRDTRSVSQLPLPRDALCHPH